MNRRRWLVGGLVVAAVSGAVIGAAGLSALTAADALEQAHAGLTRAHDTNTTTADSLAALRRAQDDVENASDALDGWHVDLVAALPVLGRTWKVERAVTRTAEEVIVGGSVLAERLPAVQADAGGVDLAALADLRADLEGPVDRAAEALAHLRASSAALTPSQVSQARADALDALGSAVETLAKAQRGLGLVSGLLGESGPRSLLVMLQNNAELRGAGGYAATFATGRLDNGRLALDPMQDVVDVADAPALARRVPAPDEYFEDFGHLAANSTIWRSWNMSPHVPDSALVGARIAGALLEDEPDLVVLIDVPAMAALVSLGDGTVTLPDGSAVGPDELTEALLVDAYAEAGAGVEAQLQRRAELQTAATSAVERLLSGDVAAAEAARTMARLAAERHLSVWSGRPQEQEALVELGVAGAVASPPGGDLSHVSVNNIGGNKLDVYVDRDVFVDVTVHEDHAEVMQRVRFTNQAPDGLVPYVAGFERPGLVVSRVELSLPPTATRLSATLDGRPWPGAVNTGAVRQRVTTRLELPQGASSVLEARYVLPLKDGTYRLRLVPQALAKDASLDLTVRPAKGTDLLAVTGATRDGQLVHEREQFVRSRLVQVDLGRGDPSRWERIRKWWNSPVQLGLASRASSVLAALR